LRLLRDRFLLEAEREPDDRPTVIHFSDPIRVGHPHLRQVDRVGALAAHDADLLDVDPRRVGRHDEHREAAMRAVVRARTRQHEDVLNRVGGRGPHLLPVDDPVVAIASRRGAGAGDIGAGPGFGVAESEGDAAEASPAALRDLGFEIERRAPGKIRVTAVPQLLVDTDVESLVRDVLGDLVQQGVSTRVAAQADALLAEYTEFGW